MTPKSIFAPRTFLLALAAGLVGLLVGGAVPVVGSIGRYVGLFVATFAVGLALSERHYLEIGVAGALAAGAGFVLNALSLSMLPIGASLLAEHGVTVAGVGVSVGALVALSGYYFGRDLRAGMTKKVD